MKKILTMATAIILATGTTAFAAEKKIDGPVNQKTNYQLPFTTMEVENGIDVLLVESPEKSIEFTGADADIAKVDWEVKNGVLRIKSKKGSLKGKVRVTVNVSGLREILIKGESEVKSEGELHSDALKISLDGGGFVSVRNTGKITVINENGTELDVYKAIGDVKIG